MTSYLESLPYGEWVLPVIFLAGGILLGLMVESYLLAKVRSAVDRTRWKWDDLVLGTFRGMAFVWFAAGGAFVARQAAPLPSGIGVMVDKVIIVAVGLSLTVVGARVAAGAIQAWARGTDGALPSTSLLQNVARILVVVLGVFLILQNLGVKVGALVASLGIGGLAVALALQDTLSNLFAGFQIILARQVRSGDFIRLDTGEEGYVTDIKWRNTTIKSRVEDHEVVVPNAKLSNAIVTNFNLPQKPLWVRLELGVSYDSDLERVEEVTLAVARQVMEELDLAGDHYPDPVLRYQGFGDSAISFGLRIRVDEFTAQFRIRHLLIKRIHARYREEGIEIPFPIRTLFAPKGLDAGRAATPDEAPSG